MSYTPEQTFAIRKHLFNACHPLSPASPELYVDLAEARGRGAFTTAFCEQVQLSEGLYGCYIFSGHYGSGKSSELKHLCEKIPDPQNTGAAYLPIFVNTEEYLDENDTHILDILFSVAAEMGATFKNELGVDIQGSYLSKFLNDLKEILQTNIGVNTVDVSLGVVKVQFQNLKNNRFVREIFRTKLRSLESELLNALNDTIAQARLQLRKHGRYHDFVIVIDNLEKVQKAMGKEGLRDSYEALFIDKAPQLRGMHAHTVCTLPLEFIRSRSAVVWTNLYGCEPFVLPMVKVFERDGVTHYTHGREMLKELLGKRLQNIPNIGDVFVDDVFTPGALECLFTYCAGDIRSLMYFIRESLTETKTPPVSIDAVYNSQSGRIGTFATSISHWDKLAALDNSPDQAIENSDPDYQTLLRQGAILEYMNGETNSSRTRGFTPWYAVHPLVKELDAFLRAKERLATELLAKQKLAGSVTP